MGKLGPRGFFCLISTFTFTGQSWFDPLFFIFVSLEKKTWSVCCRSEGRVRDTVVVNDISDC